MSDDFQSDKDLLPASQLFFKSLANEPHDVWEFIKVAQRNIDITVTPAPEVAHVRAKPAERPV